MTAATVRVEQGAAAFQIFGDGQVALPGRSLPSRVGVQVQDAGGRAVAAVAMRFTVTAGGGTAGPESAVSDVSGLASTVWTVGPAVGEQRLVASVAGGAEREFTARAVGPDSAATAVELHTGGGETTRRGRDDGCDGARWRTGRAVRFRARWSDSRRSLVARCIRTRSGATATGLSSAQWTLGLGARVAHSGRGGGLRQPGGDGDGTGPGGRGCDHGTRAQERRASRCGARDPSSRYGCEDGYEQSGQGRVGDVRPRALWRVGDAGLDAE